MAYLASVKTTNILPIPVLSVALFYLIQMPRNAFLRDYTIHFILSVCVKSICLYHWAYLAAVLPYVDGEYRPTVAASEVELLVSMLWSSCWSCCGGCTSSSRVRWSCLSWTPRCRDFRGGTKAGIAAMVAVAGVVGVAGAVRTRFEFAYCEVQQATPKNTITFWKLQQEWYLFSLKIMHYNYLVCLSRLAASITISTLIKNEGDFNGNYIKNLLSQENN